MNVQVRVVHGSCTNECKCIQQVRNVGSRAASLFKLSRRSVATHAVPLLSNLGMLPKQLPPLPRDGLNLGAQVQLPRLLVMEVATGRWAGEVVSKEPERCSAVPFIVLLSAALQDFADGLEVEALAVFIHILGPKQLLGSEAFPLCNHVLTGDC